MKAILTITLGALLSAAPAALANSFTMDDVRPTGRLDISKKLVRSGVKPMIDWEINFPLGLRDIVGVQPDDSIETKQETLMKVRMAGASYQPYGYDAQVSLLARISSQGSSWQNLFQGTNGDLDPSDYVFQSVVPANTTIDFSGRGKKSRRSWTPSRDTLTENHNIIVLRDGDDVPQYSPAFQQGDIESHVSSFVQDGKVVLGPRDMIYLVELGQTDVTSGGFDMQDLVFIVTFEDVPAE